MVLSVSVVLLLAIIVVMLVRKQGLKTIHAIVCVLLGFYLASSSVAPTIDELSTNLAGVLEDIDP
ncbi:MULTISPECIES: hypothetical protein [unclassified Streptomyces]|uniref:hypothetical protein n=1 Tax=unclassified Streptomyces TaxID=2593676 RepID=UPI001110E50E|nr:MULTISPECIES: hypothetical protein [unclassified Streptomyces]MCI3932863.1 hypothetical protein [Streptomyces sp. AN091965]QCX78903.1 hypothetical protein C9F11_26465 [Streptomyces sp. YIM 121038]